MSQSSIQVIDHPNGKIAQVHGVIDGTFDLSPLLGEHEIVLIDLDGVSRITSFGVREWRATLSQLSAQYLCFVGCHPSLVSQFNLVPGFACGGELISFYLPYICPECNHVAEALLDLRGDDRSLETLEAPAVRCPECAAPMEFDDIPAAYFKYARSVPRPRPPAAASAMIDERNPETVVRELSVKKEVEDTVTAFWLSGALTDKRALRRLTDGIEGQVVLELSDLDGITADGCTALGRFLGEAGEVYLCRVPETLAHEIADFVRAGEHGGCQLVSIDASIPCPSCGARTDMELDAARLATFADDSTGPYEHCGSCGKRLGADTIPRRILDATATLPLVDPPEPVRIYLDNRANERAEGQMYTAPGRLLFGNYRILRSLGAGGMGEVLLARYVGVEKFEKLVVLKRISRDYLKNPRALAEFQNEARVTARLSHPNIVQIFDFSKFEDEYFFAMEYVNGIDLRRALRLCSEAELPWPAPLCMRVISDVCAGLAAAHEYRNEEGALVPIYHRDVSPENVIISVDGAVKLMDFGIAKAADSSVITGSGVFKGKHAYCAPEQLEFDVPTDHRADIYAAGIVLFELLALRRFMGDEPTATQVFATTRRPPPILSALRDDIPEGLQQVFERATAADLDARYQTAFELKDDLETLMKKGEYASSHDLSAWIRRVMTLDRGGPEEPLPSTPALAPVEHEQVITAVERVVTGRGSRMNRAKGRDDEA